MDGVSLYRDCGPCLCGSGSQMCYMDKVSQLLEVERAQDAFSQVKALICQLNLIQSKAENWLKTSDFVCVGRIAILYCES